MERLFNHHHIPTELRAKIMSYIAMKDEYDAVVDLLELGCHSMEFSHLAVNLPPPQDNVVSITFAQDIYKPQLMWKIKLDYLSKIRGNMMSLMLGMPRESSELASDYTYSYDDKWTTLDKDYRVYLSDKYVWSYNRYNYPDDLWMKRAGSTAPFKRCAVCSLKIGVSGRNTCECLAITS